MDPFQKFETLARGGIPTPPAPLAPAETAPRTLRVDGIAISSDRLDALDRLHRTARATQAGLSERVHDLRAQKQDCARRMSLLAARASGDPRAHADTVASAAEIEAELTTINAALREAEAELTSAAEAAGAARENLQSAIAMAREVGLAIPAGINVEGRTHA